MSESPNGTRYCRYCGFSDCRAANGGLCPRWPAAAPMDLIPGYRWGDSDRVLIEYAGPVSEEEDR